ncbi:unnamed protein product [Alopecurus aequalis]
MEALLRQGARRIGGSVLQRTQAAVSSPAVAEERRRLVPRCMLSTEKPTPEAIQQKKEVLYESLSKVESFRDRVLLQDLAMHVHPRPHEKQWRWLRVARKISNFVETSGTAVFVSLAAVVSVHLIYDGVFRQVAMEKEKQVKQVAMERGSQMETLMEKQV